MLATIVYSFTADLRYGIMELINRSIEIDPYERIAKVRPSDYTTAALSSPCTSSSQSDLIASTSKNKQIARSDSQEYFPRESRADDRFFVIASILLPYIAEVAYAFDVFYYHNHQQLDSGYDGLVSSILSVFVYLQYCAPLRSRCLRLFFYHTSLWSLSQIGTLAHVNRGLHVHMPIEQEHLFHFISRLEVILELFIPVFLDVRLVILTRDNVAF
ncbi:unnamed protein product [Rotaria socialis]